MANSARNQPGVERTSQSSQETDPLLTIQSKYEKNKKAINTSITVVLVVVLGYFVYQKMYKAPREDKASNAIAYAQLYFQVDSLNMALNGDGKNAGFLKITKKYDGTAAANLSHYYSGVCYIKGGDYKNAIKQLEEFDGKGTMIGRQAYGLLGDAYRESGNVKKAIENYTKATEDKDDIIVTPMYLYKAGLAYEADKQDGEAKKAFERIRDEYPRSMQARDMDKELARLGELN